MSDLPSQIAYGGGVKKCHIIALWQRYNGYLTLLEMRCGSCPSQKIISF